MIGKEISSESLPYHRDKSIDLQSPSANTHCSKTKGTQQSEITSTLWTLKERITAGFQG